MICMNKSCDKPFFGFEAFFPCVETCISYTCLMKVAVAHGAGHTEVLICPLIICQCIIVLSSVLCALLVTSGRGICMHGESQQIFQ